MSEFIKTLNKYVILLIVSSLWGMPWLYIRWFLFQKYENINIEVIKVINAIPNYFDWFFRILIIVLLIIDFKKYNLKNVILSCVAALFSPFLGIFVFVILLLLDVKKQMKIKFM